MSLICFHILGFEYVAVLDKLRKCELSKLKEIFLSWRNSQSEEGDDGLYTVLAYRVYQEMDRHQTTCVTTEVHSQIKLENSLGEPFPECLRIMGMKKEPWLL